MKKIAFIAFAASVLYITGCNNTSNREKDHHGHDHHHDHNHDHNHDHDHHHDHHHADSTEKR